jgi:hypothetical protein
MNYKAAKVILSVPIKQCCGSGSVIKWPSGSGSLIFYQRFEEFWNVREINQFFLEI